MKGISTGCLLFLLALPAPGQAQVEVPAGVNWVASTQSGRFYWVGCDAWKELPDASLLFFETESEALEYPVSFRRSRIEGCSRPPAGTPVNPASEPARSGWDRVTRMFYDYDFKDDPGRIDDCALKLAHEVEFDPHTDWPAYCNDYRDTRIVQDRVTEIRSIVEGLGLSPTQREQLRRGVIWIGASTAAAEVSWGRPEDINRTISAQGTREQWVYGSGSYLYFMNGRLTAIQN